MLFNSTSFFMFLAVTLIVCALLRKFSVRLEIWFLIIASAYFYGQWNWTYLILIYITICTDYVIGLKCYQSNQPQKFLNISLLVNLGILGFFKYINFLFDSANTVVNELGYDYQLAAIDILLPVGISFYTFQSLSYTIDIHRSALKPRKKFSDYALFVSFFPQLVAGPIVRASEFFEQLDKKRAFTFAMAQKGVFLICLGLVKKVVFSDNLSQVVDPVFESPQDFDGFQTMLAVYAFAFQIYFDFSGYTDIAIGVALLLGFEFPKNFNHPYVALSIQDFWRRWHMTLSRWLRDYLYISLGGNRKGRWKTQRNLFLTMFLGGLWHGASWNFAIWGVLHGLYLAIERQIQKATFLHWNLENKLVRLFKWFIIFNLVCFAWIFFRAQDFDQSAIIIHNIFTMKGGLSLGTLLQPTVFMLVGFMLLHKITHRINFADRCLTMSNTEYVAWQTTFLILLLFFAVREAETFMYFQF